MYDLMVMHFDVFCFAIACFFAGFLFFPFTKNIISFDLKIVVGIYSSLFYLIATYFGIYVGFSGFFNKFEFLFIMFILLFFFSYLVSLVIHFSLAKVDARFVGSLILFGFLSVCLGLKLYFLIVILFLILLIIGGVFNLLDKFNLISRQRTLMFKCRNFETVEKAKLVLGLFKAQLISTKIHRGDNFIFTCEYRLNNLSHHILSKYMFNQKEISEIVFYEQ
jgi:hypothetical protein